MFEPDLYDRTQGPLNADYLDILHRVTRLALDDHPRTLAVRVDLHFSPRWFSDDALTCVPNLSGCPLSRFTASLKSKISHYRHRLKKQGRQAHRCTPRYVWIKEIDSAVHHHYHLVLFFNKDLFWQLGAFDPAKSSLCTLIQDAWLSALNLKGHDEHRALVHFPDRASCVLNTRRADFHDSYSRFMFRASYLAKERSKAYSPAARSIGASQR
ncbi:inovirus Gp2 family protein [Lelliottia sp. SL45]|uniref:inovirus Gp2 family protein n=1 Tax=Lelliottia sp. SL45 TaxID=2994665 RepID=UPI0022728A89|nr:inovirus Gp2 family protein [Lelliottia sp. SL45]MCY1700915.1 inovirus Gp2 family protein [Lelliottia sp. SL45]